MLRENRIKVSSYQLGTYCLSVSKKISSSVLNTISFTNLKLNSTVNPTPIKDGKLICENKNEQKKDATMAQCTGHQVSMLTKQFG